MEFISIFFILISLILVSYFAYLLLSGNRLHIIVELFFLVVYLSILIIFLFPQVLKLIEQTLGIRSALNFIIYLSIFVAYFIIFLLYNKTEKQRQEITKLTREIALMNKRKKKE